MQTEVNPFSAPIDKKISFLHTCIEWCIGKCPGLRTIVFKTWYLKFMLNHAVIYIVWDTLDFSILCPNCVLGALTKTCAMKLLTSLSFSFATEKCPTVDCITNSAQ